MAERKTYNEADLFLHIQLKKPNHVPVVVLPSRKCDPVLKQHNFLIHEERLLSELIRHVQLQFRKERSESLADQTDRTTDQRDYSAQGLYFFVGESEALPPLNTSMGDLFTKYGTDRKYLVVKYAIESSFG